ncbi:glycosyltransferase [Alteromonas aestuariivivens]|uniref:Glycosyltransferase n=1 Tax=Alteromonas aestuariivivens TaxID=1938339 RepID=A0A3D8M9M3_9ALTE|nr:glycosyltransferase [Alteromonas aestuariivivens]RDV26564.1 glycosyltransferase [Alteromonas aestuariivivens]
MHNHHRYSSFKTFASRVLGISSVKESEFDEYVGDISFSFDLKEENGLPTLSTNLSAKNLDASSVATISSAEIPKNAPLLEEAVTAGLMGLSNALTSAYSVDNEELSSRLIELEQLMSADVILLPKLKKQIDLLLAEPRFLISAIDRLTNIALLSGSESILTESLLANLEQLFGDERFVKDSRNIRCLQQVLASVPTDREKIIRKLSSVNIPTSSHSQDAFIAVVLSVAQDAEIASAIFESANLEKPVSNVRNYERTIETLSRSPIKINFVSHLSVLQHLFSQLSTAKTPHAKLLFRAYYFCSGTNREWLKSYPFGKILEKIFSFKENDFNDVYRDVRRSLEIPVDASDLSMLLRQMDVKSLSLSKIIYLYSLLPQELDDGEKLAFLCRAMIERGLPVINSQESLTLSAALGLKSLSNQIINEVLRVNGASPVLPENTKYDLISIFDSVLENKTIPRAHDFGLISVIVTTFNPDISFLEKALNSVLSQNYPNLEIIVIDDCSTKEKSLQIESLCKTTSSRRVLYHRNDTNVGQYVSRNTAIGLSQGDFIAIQDDDDVSHPERLALQVRALNKSSALACFTKHVRYSDDGRLSVDDPRNLLVLGDGPATLLFKRELIGLIGGFRNYRSRGDIDFRTRIEQIAGADSVVRLDAPLYFMRSSLTTVSSMYEYFNGDQLIFYRRKIDLMKAKKATEQV